jgi:2-polyprenyl-3-methyl-5-hydroxy-6-metoxy-1,4-benzoquinol methylase
MGTDSQQYRVVTCNLCGSQDDEVLSFRGRNGKLLRTVICRQCGLVYSSPRPIEDETRMFYSKQYRLEYKHSFTPQKRRIYRAGRVALTRYAEIRDIIKSHSVVLDIGSGGGEFIYLLRCLGHDARGIEPNEGYAKYSIDEYGLPVRVGFIQDVNFAGDTFHVITLYHVLEHIEDPLGIICRVSEWLTPDGFLVVEVPNVEAVCQAPSHRFHKAHLYNFNQNTLEMLGRKGGYSIHRTTVSADEGNLLTIFRRSARVQRVSGRIPGNCERIRSIVDGHTAPAHYLSHYPYARLIGRLAQSIEERRQSKKYTRGKDILDSFFGARVVRT